MNTIADELGSHNAFAGDIDMLKNIADRHLPHFAGGNGRYRYAKAIDIASRNMTSDGTKTVQTLFLQWLRATKILQSFSICVSLAKTVLHRYIT